MPRKGASQERIVYALKQAEAGVKTSEICRENGISEQTFYNWKRKYGGMGISELRRLRLLLPESSPRSPSPVATNQRVSYDANSLWLSAADGAFEAGRLAGEQEPC